MWRQSSVGYALRGTLRGLPTMLRIAGTFGRSAPPYAEKTGFGAKVFCGAFFQKSDRLLALV
jgi:hypothetical protein